MISGLVAIQRPLMARCLVSFFIVSCAAVFPAQGIASLPTLTCSIDLFFDKAATTPLEVVSGNKGSYPAMSLALEKLNIFKSKYPSALFYVQGSISGQEDASPDYKIAKGRAISAVHWMLQQGILPERIFAYAVVPATQTKYGHGAAAIFVCDLKSECACPHGFAQRTQNVNDPGFSAVEIPIPIQSFKSNLPN